MLNSYEDGNEKSTVFSASQTTTRTEVILHLLTNYEIYYKIKVFEEKKTPVAACCDHFEYAEKNVVSRQTDMWSTDREEYLYILDIPRLSLSLFQEWQDYVYKDGMKRIHVGPDHMCSYITAIFVCDFCDEDARKALQKYRRHKIFRFSLHGWMDCRSAVIEVSKRHVDSNKSGQDMVKFLKKMLYE